MNEEAEARLDDAFRDSPWVPHRIAASLVGLSPEGLSKAGDRGEIRFRLRALRNRMYVREDIEAYILASMSRPEVALPIFTIRCKEGSHISSVLEQPADGFVYILQADGFAKIGWTKDVRDRIAKLQTGHPIELNLLACIAGSRGLEVALHAEFRSLRHRAEWFRYEGALRSFVEDLQR